MIVPIFNTPETHKAYFDFIRGKRVIFVGPAPNMIGRGLGEWIDSYDVVVRTNNFPVIMQEKNYAMADYGTKCHVLYTNMQYYHKMRPLPLEIYKKVGIKWLCMKRCKEVDYRIMHRDFKIRETNRSAKHVFKLLKTPLMGSIILYDLSEFVPSEIAIAGIDFYTSSGKDYSAYIDGYIPEQIREENIKKKIGQGVGHDCKANAEYIANLYDRGRVVIPDFIVEKMREVLDGGE